MPYAQQARPNTSSSRPGTASSLSSLPSMSSMGSSLNGAQLAALVQRRGQLRAQMQRVDQMQSRIAPSGGGSSAPPTAPPQSAAHVARQPQHQHQHHPCGGTLAQLHSQQASCALDTRPAGSCGQRATTASATTGQAATSQPPQPQLPGALQPGRYAFWPKGLAANRAPLAASKSVRRGAPLQVYRSASAPGHSKALGVGENVGRREGFHARRTLTPVTIGI